MMVLGEEEGGSFKRRRMPKSCMCVKRRSRRAWVGAIEMTWIQKHQLVTKSLEGKNLRAGSLLLPWSLSKLRSKEEMRNIDGEGSGGGKRGCQGKTFVCE
jgi:hypothetical protein